MVSKRLERLLLAFAVLGFLAATALAYSPGLHGPFLFDDSPNITDNPGIRLASLAPLALLHAAFSSRSGLLYRPVSMLSFALNLYWFGGESFSFKLTNLIIHLGNALLILWLTWRLLVNCRRRYEFSWPDRTIAWMSVIVAGAWALHPLNLTSVLYIVQRMTSLSALFTLAGILAYVCGRERMVLGQTGWPFVWLLTPCFGLIGVLCKEDAALLPLYLLVIEWLVFGFRTVRQVRSKSVPAFFLCALVVPGILGFAYLVHHPQSFLGGYAYRDFTLPERILTEFRVVLLYIQWTFIPDIRQLALYHDDIAVSTGLLSPLSTLWSLLALTAFALLAWFERRRRPLLSLGILFFFAGQTMESTILPLQLAFEHRNYLPDYGLLLAVFSLLLLPAAGDRKTVRLRLRWTVAVLALPVLFSTTLLRASEWDNYLDFTYYEAHHHPGSEPALYELGQEYSNLTLSGYLKTPAKALNTLAQAASISTNIMPDTALILVSAKLKRPVNPAWQRHAETLMQKYPVASQDTASLASLVNCLPSACKSLYPTAHALIRSALHSKNIAKLPRSNADLWVIYGNYLTFTDAPLSKVIAAMRRSVEFEPRIPQYRISYVKALTMAGEFDQAAAQIRILSRQNLFGSLDHTLQELQHNLAAGRALRAKEQRAVPAPKPLEPHRATLLSPDSSGHPRSDLRE